MNLLDIVCGGAGILKIIKFIFMLLDIVFIIVPIGLIIMVSIDFAKSVIANSAEEMSKNAKLAFKRVLSCVALFLVTPICSFVITLVGDQGINTFTCIDIAKNDDLSLYEIEFKDENYEAIKVNSSSPSGVVPSNGSNTTSNNSSNVTASNSKKQISAQKFLDSLEKMSKKVQQDAKNGKKWKYSNSNTKNTFNIANNSTKQTNCALYVVWGLIDIDVMKSKQRFYKAYSNNKNFIKYSKITESEMKKHLTYISGKNKSASELIKDGTLQAGDIVLWYNHQHTNVYAGKERWYDAGRQANANGSGGNDSFYFTTLGPVKLSGWMNQKVWKILRIK